MRTGSPWRTLWPWTPPTSSPSLTARASPPTSSRPSERASCSPQGHPCSAGVPPGDPRHRGSRGGDGLPLPLQPRLLVVLGGTQ
uniref:Uncharacterized protein n=1 Tax=Oryza barthii TaxID=65489 RepID=A0A0D3GYC6_9ORYZ